MYDYATVGRDLAVIAVGPDIGVGVKIGGVKFFSVFIGPESDGAGGEGFRANQLALFPDYTLACVVPDGHRHAEAEAL